MVISSSCDKPETLNELTQLRDCEFGQPHPRHGLRLLHWLAHDHFIYDRSATLLCEPSKGEYGFHYFKNRENDLPSVSNGYNYYIVGNLNKPKAQHLPFYVWENNSGNQDDSNRDRIILSVGPGNVIDKIYATEHQGKGRFNNKHTYCISKGLMRNIKKLELQMFLSKMENNPLNLQAPEMKAASASMPDTVINIESSSPSRGFWDYWPYNYYIVGNLNKPKVQHLPFYVWENNSGNQDDSNRDRIILSVGPGNVIDKIYATEHQGKGCFNNKHTYCISKDLMMIIKELELPIF